MPGRAAASTLRSPALSGGPRPAARRLRETARDRSWNPRRVPKEERDLVVRRSATSTREARRPAGLSHDRLIDAVAAGSAPAIFGLSLLERHLHGLRNLKPAPTRVIIDLAAGAAEPKLGDKRLYRLQLEWRRGGESYAERLGQVLAAAAAESLLVLDATTLADPRLPATLAVRTASTIVRSREAQDRAAILFLADDHDLILAELHANPGTPPPWPPVWSKPGACRC